jgi:VanZ like family
MGSASCTYGGALVDAEAESDADTGMASLAVVPRSRTWIVAIFWIYVAAMAAVTVAPAGVHRRHQDSWWSVVQLVPLHVPPISFVLNIVMFVPFGLLVPLLWPRADGIGRVAGLSLAASTAIELTQLALWLTVGNHRTVDVNDLIANTAGGVLGLLAMRFVSQSTTARRERRWSENRLSGDHVVDPGLQSEPVAVRLTMDDRRGSRHFHAPPGLNTSDASGGWTGECSASITLAKGRVCIGHCDRRRRGTGGRGGRRDDERAAAAKSQHRTCDQTEHAERQDGRHQGLTSPAAQPPLIGWRSFNATSVTSGCGHWPETWIALGAVSGVR